MIFMAFKTDAFKEYLLPDADNTDYQLYIDKKILNLNNSFNLLFEVIDHRWIIKSGKSYRLIVHKKIVDSVAVDDFVMFTVETGKDVIKGIFFNDRPVLSPYEKIDLSICKNITVGMGEDNDIRYEFMSFVSRHHCYITLNNKGGFSVVDTSSNGVFVNHKRIREHKSLHFGDLIEIFGLKMLFLNRFIAVDTYSAGKVNVSEHLPRYIVERFNVHSSTYKHEDDLFNPSPRAIKRLFTDEIVIEPPTSNKITKKKSLIATIGPSLTMAIPMLLGVLLIIIASSSEYANMWIFMMTGFITALGSGIFGAIWAYVSYKNEKKGELDDENQRFNLYSNYLIEMSEYIKDRYKQNYYALHSMYPPSSACTKYYRYSSELWNRNSTHEDFFYYRLGLGDIDFQADIKIPKKEFSLEYDLLRDKPLMLYDNFKTLKNVPVGHDFKSENIFGIAGGPDRSGIYQIVNDLIAQITSSAPYTEIKIAFCFNGKNNHEKHNFEYIKWFPHVWSENRTMRYYAYDEQDIQDVLFELSNIIRTRSENMAQSNKTIDFKPYYFLFVSDISMLEGELISKYIFDKNRNYGLTTFIMTDNYRNLPNTCETIIQNDSAFKGIFKLSGEYTGIDFDSVSIEEMTAFAKRISDLKVAENEDDNTLPSSLTFLEMYGLHSFEEFNIIEQWRKNRTYTSMRALIGKKSGNTDCYLDIHEKHHGPHGLVAGTTGSGKSELLQTYMLSLALNYSPDDIAFFVIDFKGGGMANLFSDLPHMAGQISNLSGNQISRAMISIKSENIRRQKLFSDFGVNNINLYTRLYKDGKADKPMPHLIIIIDEFAELKKEEPEFMKELISVAQVGRSLGVHLILATQKPSGTVDDNIWSNSKFRLCLRVQDRQDSNDMLHKYDAAYITQAGRCYLQVGNDEIYELFQSGYSGAVYEKNSDELSQDIATIITSTGKTALVGSHTKMKYIKSERNRWYGFLYSTICSLAATGNYSYSDNANDREKLAEDVIAAAQKSGFNIDSSDSDIKSIMNFIRLMPDSSFTTENAVQYIIEKAQESTLKMPELKETTQLEAAVQYISQIADENGYVRRASLWMPLLKKIIILGDLTDDILTYENGIWTQSETFSLSCTVGMYDDPSNQSQLPLKIDFVEGGHLAVCGSVVTGKSTFLQTLIYSMICGYSPETINFYIIDFSSGMLSCFEKAPHCGGVVRDDQPEKIAKLFNMISSVIESRKKLFEGGNFNQYVKNHRNEVSAMFIVIDNYPGFREKTDNIYEDVLVQLSREGVAYGVFLILTSQGFGISEIQSRIGDNIRNVVSLEMSDKLKYTDILRTTHIDVLPESGIKGRGLAYVDGRLLEFQTALAVNAEDDYKRSSAIEKTMEEMGRLYVGRMPKPIPYIPEMPSYDDLYDLDEYGKAIKRPELLPFAYRYEDASVYSVDLRGIYCYSISGKKRTGKTNVLKLFMAAVHEKEGKGVVIEYETNNLHALTDALGYKYIENDSQVFNYFNSITGDFVERNKYKRELQAQGLSDEEIFNKMSGFRPIFIFIDNLNDFVRRVYNPSDEVGSMSGFFENILDKGFLHNIFFFGCIDSDETDISAGYKCFDYFVRSKRGIHLGGYLTSQKIFDFQNLHYSQMSKGMKKNEGFAASLEDDTFAIKVILPHYGGVIQ